MSLSMISGLIPKIEGFQPIPNAVMIPFMETQSAALAFGFGLNYEFGKRTIRSMSNEKFNSLTSEQIAEMSAQHSTVLLNRFIQAVPQVMPAQTEIFKQYVTIEKAKVIQNFQLAKWTLADLPGILLGLGINIKDLSSTITDTPSATGTTIIQDKEGNVTTTQAPVHHEVELTEELPITAQIDVGISFWIFTSKPKISTLVVGLFMKRAYPKGVNITSIKSSGGVNLSGSSRTFQGNQYNRKDLYIVKGKSDFPLPKIIQVTWQNMEDLKS